MIGVIDYGAGNLQSVANALRRLEQAFVVCTKPRDLDQVRCVLLPGVGQFAAAMHSLQNSGLDDALRGWGRDDRPMIGICLGLQLLFEASAEASHAPGLGLIPGRSRRLQTTLVPHMGWNSLQVESEVAWMNGAQGRHMYFAHSYAIEPACREDICASVEIDALQVPAAVQRGALRAVQFHPEKSGPCGNTLLQRMVTC